MPRKDGSPTTEETCRWERFKGSRKPVEPGTIFVFKRKGEDLYRFGRVEGLKSGWLRALEQALHTDAALGPYRYAFYSATSDSPEPPIDLLRSRRLIARQWWHAYLFTSGHVAPAGFVPLDLLTRASALLGQLSGIVYAGSQYGIDGIEHLIDVAIDRSAV